MKTALPFESKSLEDVYQNNESGTGGFYPVGQNNFWHGGIHLSNTKTIQAVADGKLIAYRMTKDFKKVTLVGKEFEFSDNFVLLQHQFETPQKTTD